MRCLLFLAIFSVIIISLCAQLPGLPFFQANQTQVSQVGVVIIDSESPDALIRVEAIPPEVKSGRSITMYFEIQNKNPYDLRNVNVEVYDPCVFTGDFSKFIDIIKANRSIRWPFTWKVEKMNLDKDCNIKFRISYETNNSYFQDIAVLSEAEYQQRELEGTLQQVPVRFSYPNSPFKISLKFSDDQPLINNESYYMYIDYTTVGSGFLNINSVAINVPNNVKDFSCKDYSLTKICYGAPSSCNSFGMADCENQRGCNYNYEFEICRGTPSPCTEFDASNCDNQIGCKIQDVLSLNRTLNFVGNRASTSTCSFKTMISQPMQILSLVLTTSYKYILDNSISVRVKP